MSKNSQYITTNRSKHYLKCHLILVTKYHKNILVGQLWLLHHPTLRQHYWYRNLLWPDGYFVCLIGEASPETIRQYILSQG